MYHSAEQTQEMMELDFARLFSVLGRKSWRIALVSVVCAALAFWGTFLLVTPKYQSSVMFYVNNNSVALGDVPSGITSSDILASQSLVSTYIVILDTWETLTDVINHSGVNRTYEELSEMLSAEAVADTQVFRVVVTSPDAQEALEIARAITKVLPQRISGIIEGTSAQMVDSALLATKPCSPHYGKAALIGFMVGFALSAGWILLREIFDGSIRTAADIPDSCGYPVLACIPQKQEEKQEAFSGLAAKLQFMFADDKSCRVLALSGKDEHRAAAAFAEVMAKQGKRVLLMECDLRHSGKHPGLSDYLAGQSDLPGLIRQRETESFHRLSAGHGSLTPAELLKSTRMELLLENLRQEYDGILLELPEIRENRGALETCRFADGVMLMLHHKSVSRTGLRQTLALLERENVRILGVICHGNGRKDRHEG